MLNSMYACHLHTHTTFKYKLERFMTKRVRVDWCKRQRWNKWTTKTKTNCKSINKCYIIVKQRWKQRERESAKKQQQKLIAYTRATSFSPFFFSLRFDYKRSLNMFSDKSHMKWTCMCLCVCARIQRFNNSTMQKNCWFMGTKRIETPPNGNKLK